MMLPIIVRSSEEMLRLVPEDQRAASAGLGARKWQTVTKVVLPMAAPGLTTGCMLAVARAAGETAVLILTALGSLRLVDRLHRRTDRVDHPARLPRRAPAVRGRVRSAPGPGRCC
jgi:ABC-type phosphate transport system permease subunit